MFGITGETRTLWEKMHLAITSKPHQVSDACLSLYVLDGMINRQTERTFSTGHCFHLYTRTQRRMRCIP